MDNFRMLMYGAIGVLLVLLVLRLVWKNLKARKSDRREDVPPYPGFGAPFGNSETYGAPPRTTAYGVPQGSEIPTSPHALLNPTPPNPSQVYGSHGAGVEPAVPPAIPTPLPSYTGAVGAGSPVATHGTVSGAAQAYPYASIPGSTPAPVTHAGAVYHVTPSGAGPSQLFGSATGAFPGGAGSGLPPLPKVNPETTPLVDGSDYLFGSATPALAAMLPESDERCAVVRSELLSAGYYEPHAFTNFSALRYLGIMLPLLALGVLLFVAPPRFERIILIGMLVLPLLGWAMPRLMVKARAADRKRQIEHAMPDLLDMLNMCVSQGMTIPASIKRVAFELPRVHPALHRELQIVSQQADMGTMAKALENFSQRCNVPEVHSFVGLLTQTERMGTSVSRALSEYSEGMRSSLQQRADAKGNRAAFWLLLPTVMCLMPAVFMFLLGPSIIEMTEFQRRDATSLDRATQIIQQTGRSPQQQQLRDRIP